jgi:hypothetical protein
VGRISTGVDEAADEMRVFGGALLSKVYSLQAEIAKMPDLTLQDSIDRATRWITEMSKFKYKGAR